jgi:biopolymer transport protein ExbD
MRRFSQRSSLVTLSEINITPLLDLAFVLLIIFIITTPLLTQSIPIKLPTGGMPDRPLQASDVRTVEITPDGAYYLNRQRVSLDTLEQILVRDNAGNPNLVVDIRADERSPWRHVAAVMDRCQRNKITRFRARMEAPRR